MKKILSGLLLISFLTVLVMPMAVSAQTEMEEINQCTLKHDFSGWSKMTCPGRDAVCQFTDETKDCPMCCMMDTIYTVTDWIFAGITALVVIFVLIGAFNLLTGAGNVEKVKTGRDYIIYASIGMLVALLAKAIPAIVKAIMNLG